MAKQIPKMYKEIKGWKIYILLFVPFKSFYIGITSQKELYDTLKDHCNLKIDRTSKFIGSYIKEKHIPQIFLLETFNGLKPEAFSRSIAWAKMLKDNGYDCINGDTFEEYTNDLYQNTQKYYEEIKEYDLTEILAEGNSLYPNYKPGRKQNKNKSGLTVTLTFTPEDYEILERRACECKQGISTYLHRMAIEGVVIVADCPTSNEYLAELRELISSIQQSIITIHRMGQYFPSDLEKIQNALDGVERIYKETVKSNIKFYRKLDRIYEKFKKL